MDGRIVFRPDCFPAPRAGVGGAGVAPTNAKHPKNAKRKLQSKSFACFLLLKLLPTYHPFCHAPGVLTGTGTVVR